MGDGFFSLFLAGTEMKLGRLETHVLPVLIAESSKLRRAPPSRRIGVQALQSAWPVRAAKGFPVLQGNFAGAGIDGGNRPQAARKQAPEKPQHDPAQQPVQEAT
jgi:hypothetical protein